MVQALQCLLSKREVLSSNAGLKALHLLNKLQHLVKKKKSGERKSSFLPDLVPLPQNN
jgi:hypothetical protein